MLLRVLTFVVILAVLHLGSYAQEKESIGTAVYVELVGKGFVSGNIDLPIGSRSRLTLALTLLDHEFEKDDDEQNYPTMTLPTPGIMYLHLFGQEQKYFEAGIGLSVSPVPWMEYSDDDSALSLHASLGYRYQKPDHFFFRAGFTPFYRINWAFLPLFGVSFGYSW